MYDIWLSWFSQNHDRTFYDKQVIQVCWHEAIVNELLHVKLQSKFNRRGHVSAAWIQFVGSFP
jgi:hypothetical protein